MSNLFADAWGRTFVQGGTVSGVDDVLARSPIGNPGTAVTDSLYGLNHRSLANSIPINKDYYGLTFFTKPDLRLDKANCLKLRKLSPLLTSRGNTLPRAIRAMLDFRHNSHNEESYPCGLIDPKQIFIPILTNQLVSLSGWEDIQLPTHTSDAGVYGEQFSFADGIAEIYRCFDLTASFRNIPGDPITSLFYYWVLYAAAVFEGTLTPYADNAATNSIDYQCRIFRVVLDSTKRFVQKIACTGAAFPINVPLGAAFNYDIDSVINRNDQISVNFRCIGAEYLDDIIIHDFNLLVCEGNGDMYDDQRKNAGLVKVPYEYIFLFNYLGYPRINPATFELEWWVYQETFKSLTGESSDAISAANSATATSSAGSTSNTSSSGPALNSNGSFGNTITPSTTNNATSDNSVKFTTDAASTASQNTYNIGSPTLTSLGSSNNSTSTWDPNTWPLGKAPPSSATDAELNIYNTRYQTHFEKLYG